MLRLLFALLCLTLTGPGAMAQRSKAQLERQKRENERRISEASRILEDVANKKEASLGQLSALQAQISSRQQLIANIQAELAMLDKELNGKLTRTQALARELNALKAEYGKMVYAASKAESPDAWLFVFASESFNQFFARLNHLRQYSQERRSQAAKIVSARDKLISEQKVLKAKRDQQQTLLASYTDERTKLAGLQQSESNLVKRLSAREERLKEELDRRAEADRRLERLIADMLRREMRRAEEARRRSERNSNRSRGETEERGSGTSGEMEAIPTSPETARLSASFAENKGRLGWPVEQGFISGRFGKQSHRILKGVIVENLGINIQTKSGEKVMAVAPGEVGFVADIPGVDGKIISIMHGEYITVFSHIANVRVRPGEKVKAREAIGQVASDREGVSEIQFQIWRGDTRQNPESWLVGR